MRGLILALLLVLPALPLRATEEGPWAGFYRPTEKPEAALGQAPDASRCLTAILEAEARYGIPENLLLAIGLQEAGREVGGELTVWPWTANAAGRGLFFTDKEALEAWVRQTQAAGISSIDVGCMQVNQKWHGQHFSGLEEATTPEANVDYAARFLLTLKDQTGDWWRAAGRYHSATPDLAETYLTKLAHNHDLAQAHSAGFAALAEAPQPGRNRQRAQVGKVGETTGGLLWSSELTGTTVAAARNGLSIYSDRPVQWALPDFEEVQG